MPPTQEQVAQDIQEIIDYNRGKGMDITQEQAVARYFEALQAPKLRKAPSPILETLRNLGPEAGQIIGSLAPLLFAGPLGLGTGATFAAIGAGGILGRAAGAKLAGKGASEEALIAAITELIPVMVRPIGQAGKIGAAQARGGELIENFIEMVNRFLPGRTRLPTRSFSALRAAVGGLEEKASSQFGRELEGLLDTPILSPTGVSKFGDAMITIPSFTRVTKEGDLELIPVKVRNIVSMISEKGRKATRAGEKIDPVTGTPAVPSRSRLIQELTQALDGSELLQGMGLDAAARYATIRNNMNKAMTIQRLFTYKEGGRAVLDTEKTEVNLPMLQKAFQEVQIGGPFGGVRAFPPEERLFMETMLGRGKLLEHGIDAPLETRAARLYGRPGTTPGIAGLIPQPPRAAGIRYFGLPSPRTQATIPSLLALPFTEFGYKELPEE